MALSKSKTLSSGVTGNYWRIHMILFDRVSSECAWVIGLYFNSTHANNGDPALTQKRFSKVLTSDEAASNLTNLGYTTIKAQASAIFTKDISGKTVAPYHGDEDLFDATDI